MPISLTGLNTAMILADPKAGIAGNGTEDAGRPVNVDRCK